MLGLGRGTADQGHGQLMHGSVTGNDNSIIVDINNYNIGMDKIRQTECIRKCSDKVYASVVYGIPRPLGDRGNTHVKVLWRPSEYLIQIPLVTMKHLMFARYILVKLM